MFTGLIAIAIGGSLGALSRYGLFEILKPLHDRGIELGVLTANVLGSFLIGVAFALFYHHGWMEKYPLMNLFFVTGFLGAFTTFSSFSQDNLRFLLEKHFLGFAINTSTNLVLCTIAVGLGFYLVQLFKFNS